MSTSGVIPHLVCRNAVESIDFYRRAFDAEPMKVLRAPDGKLLHGCLRINGAEVFLCEEFCEQGALAPPSLGGSAVTLHLHVGDCDAVFDRAVAAGCRPQMPLQDMFWGDRYGVLEDPYGHLWSVATTLRTLTDAELEAAALAACSGAVATA